MFGSGIKFDFDEIPYSELALRYVKPENYQFPEEYLEAYVKTVARLEKAMRRELNRLEKQRERE